VSARSRSLIAAPTALLLLLLLLLLQQLCEIFRAWH
jgi:hypothetical protein